MADERQTFFSGAITEALAEEMRRDPSVFVMGEDIGPMGGAFGATRGLHDEFGPKRVVQTPISENSIVGLGIGAAITGLRPVVEIMYMDFIGLAYDQIMNKMTKLHFLTGGEVKVPMVVRTTAGGGRFYGPDHSQSLEAIFNHLPGLVVVAPSEPMNAKALLKAAIRCDDPVLFVEYRMNYAMRGPVSTDPGYLMPLGKARVVRQGSKLTLLSWGRMLNRCREVVDADFASAGVELIDLLTIRPLDVECIARSVAKTGNLLVVEEGYRTNGVGAELMALAGERFFFDLDAPMRRISGLDMPIPFSEHLENEVLPSHERIKEGIRQCLNNAS